MKFIFCIIYPLLSQQPYDVAPKCVTWKFQDTDQAPSQNPVEIWHPADQAAEGEAHRGEDHDNQYELE